MTSPTARSNSGYKNMRNNITRPSRFTCGRGSFDPKDRTMSKQTLTDRAVKTN